MASVGRKSMYFCTRSITSEAAASDRPARRRSCGMWSSSSPRRNSGARSTSTESVTMRRTVESRRKAAITMFAFTTSRRGAASDSLPRGASRGLEPTPESFFDEAVERPHVLECEHAPMGQGIHPLQVPDSVGQKPSDDLAPLDFGTGLHLAMQFRGDGQRDIGHGLDYVRAHNQTFGVMDAGGLGGPSGSGRRAAKTLYRTSRGRSLLRVAIFWGFVGWAVLSAYWRFALPLVTGTDVQDLFQGLLGANPGALTLARNAWPSMLEIFGVWIAAAGLFLVVHVLIAVD